MGKCFVIQPFDGDKFDKRYKDHFAPAIEAANLEPYRVDWDPSVRIPINSIHTEIKKADACLADITTNNPNVWYELGYALASAKEVVIICSRERNEHTDKFPFDIQHLSIIRYQYASSSDFFELQGKITAQLKARIADQKELQTISSISPLTEVEGLSPHESAALTILLSHAYMPDSPLYPATLQEEMEKAGFTLIAVNLSIKSLIDKDMVQIVEEPDYNGDPTKMYKIQPKGMQWLLENQDKLIMRRETKVVIPKVQAKAEFDDFDDSDPFADE